MNVDLKRWMQPLTQVSETSANIQNPHGGRWRNFDELCPEITGCIGLSKDIFDVAICEGYCCIIKNYLRSTDLYYLGAVGHPRGYWLIYMEFLCSLESMAWKGGKWTGIFVLDLCRNETDRLDYFDWNLSRLLFMGFKFLMLLQRIRWLRTYTRRVG